MPGKPEATLNDIFEILEEIEKGDIPQGEVQAWLERVRVVFAQRPNVEKWEIKPVKEINGWGWLSKKGCALPEVTS